MKTITSAIVALGLIAGIAAPVAAAPVDAKSLFTQLDKEHFNLDAGKFFDQQTRDGR